MYCIFGQILTKSDNRRVWILPDRNSTWPLLESSIWVRSCRPDTPDAGGAHGLTLVHFSAQLEPYLSQENTLHTLSTLTPPKHGLHNPYAHPLSHTKRSSGAEKWTSVSPWWGLTDNA